MSPANQGHCECGRELEVVVVRSPAGEPGRFHFIEDRTELRFDLLDDAPILGLVCGDCAIVYLLPDHHLGAEVPKTAKELLDSTPDAVADLDLESRLSLGQTYHEMGRLNEAIVELRLAAQDPRLAEVARAEIDACKKELGDRIAAASGSARGTCTLCDGPIAIGQLIVVNPGERGRTVCLSIDRQEKGRLNLRLDPPQTLRCARCGALSWKARKPVEKRSRHDQT